MWMVYVWLAVMCIPNLAVGTFWEDLGQCPCVIGHRVFVRLWQEKRTTLAACRKHHLQPLGCVVVHIASLEGGFGLGKARCFFQGRHVCLSVCVHAFLIYKCRWHEFLIYKCRWHFPARL